MYHHSSSSSYYCQGSNGFLPSQQSASSYSDLLQAEQQHYYSQQQQQEPMQAQALFRRVLSTGDLGTPPSAPVAGKYSMEERRERIEKYRNKRNQRNFQKKITYACRKTLADSRPRVKGRFARNVDDVSDQQEDAATSEVSSIDSLVMNEANVVVNATDAASSSSMPEWWPAMQGALEMEDEELYLAVSTINLY